MITKDYLATFPHHIGVYLFRKGQEYIYIGKSIDIKDRLIGHWDRQPYDAKERALFEQADRIEYTASETEFHALIQESALIQQHKPRYNVIWMDNKSYLYIKIPMHDPYPRISLVRKENDGKSLYFGPFSSTRDVRFLLHRIRSLIPFCMHKQPMKTPCFYAKIGLCDPCPVGVHNETTKRRYRAQIRKVVRILDGHTAELTNELQRELKRYTESQQYELAISIRNKLLKLEELVHLRSFHIDEYKKEFDPALALKKVEGILALVGYKKTGGLDRLECYDISNLMQQQATASMVVATNGYIDKSQYRRFKIHTEGVSDFRMIAETLTRRFRTDWPHPSLLILDGGTPQVLRAHKALAELTLHIPIIGIAKRPDRIVAFFEGNIKTLRPLQENEGFRLIQALRDEAHRFAKKYHVSLRSKKLFDPVQ